jgi:mono/diheme cytochrome c family protein
MENPAMTVTDPPPSGQPAPRHPGDIRPGPWLLALAVIGIALVGLVWLGGSLARSQNTSPWIAGLLPGVRAKPVATNDESPSERGRRVYQSHCASCHGPEGHGDGPGAAALKTPLRDLASASWRSSARRDHVRRIVADGVPDKGMPGAGALAALDQEAVVDHVLGLRLVYLLLHSGFTSATGAAAPPFSYQDAEGSIGSLAQHKGEVVLVAWWCTSCYQGHELEEVQRLSDRFEGTGLVVLPVCLDERDPAKVAEFAAKRVDHLPVYTALETSTRRNYNVMKTPQAALIDRDGRFVARSFTIANLGGKELEEFLCACLGARYPLEPEDDTGE